MSIATPLVQIHTHNGMPLSLCSVVDSLQECCHCNEMSVVITSIDIVNDLLTSLEQLVNSDGSMLPFDLSPSDSDIGIISCCVFVEIVGNVITG